LNGTILGINWQYICYHARLNARLRLGVFNVVVSFVCRVIP
jgi:hypothetical protein